ncbi:hypothetical protein Q7P35_003448 [Cladosporium inversicolor]
MKPTQALMGGGPKVPYPKHVWSPAGGWYAQPKNWRANTAIMLGVVVGITAMAWSVSAEREHRYKMPERDESGCGKDICTYAKKRIDKFHRCCSADGFDVRLAMLADVATAGGNRGGATTESRWLVMIVRQIGMRMRRRVPTAVGNSECITTDDKENHVYQTSERTRHNARLKGLECAPRNN